MKYQQSIGEKAFDAANVTALGLVSLAAVYPFLYVLGLSFATPQSLADGGLLLWPSEFTLTAYELVLTDEGIRYGYFNTIFRTVFGTIATLCMTSLAAYPLSRKSMPWRRKLIFFVLFTMLFSGGLVPRYILIKNLGLIDNRLVYIIPMMLTAFNVIILKNFFQQIPDSYAEAAKMDGAGEFTILFRVFIPLSKPALATIALWTCVAHWNHWFDGLIFITSDSKQILQVFLQRIVIENNVAQMQAGVVDFDKADFASEAVKAATIVITVIPVIIVYPFLQRYFIKGITLGGIKE